MKQPMQIGTRKYQSFIELFSINEPPHLPKIESSPVAITDTVQNQVPDHSQGEIAQLHSEFL